jgi:hypothetical protein
MHWLWKATWNSICLSVKHLYMTNDSLRRIHVSMYNNIRLHLCSTDSEQYLSSNLLFSIKNPLLFKPYNERWWILKWVALNIHNARAPSA